MRGDLPRWMPEYRWFSLLCCGQCRALARDCFPMILLFYHIFGDLAIGGIKEFNKKIRGAKGRISSQFGMLVRTREWAGEAAAESAARLWETREVPYALSGGYF